VHEVFFLIESVMKCSLTCGDYVSFLIGFLPTEYAKTDGIPMFARRSLSCNASQPQQMSVLSL